MGPLLISYLGFPNFIPQSPQFTHVNLISSLHVVFTSMLLFLSSCAIVMSIKYHCGEIPFLFSVWFPEV